MKKVGYLGPRGTFTEAAAIKYCGPDEVELICYDNPAAIVSAVERGLLDEGVVPLENSTEGSVNEIMDLAAQSTGIMFRGEVVLPVRHNILVRAGSGREKVNRVLSHPQALAQCREYLARRWPGVETVDTSSTAQAACIVAAAEEPWVAIGTDLAAKVYGLEVLEGGIQDSSENATRFIVLGSTDAGPGPVCRTSLIVTGRDRPGALYSILREFALRDINLTRIESRPAKKRLGQYMFFIDMEGHRSEAGVKEAIDAVGGRATSLKVLGSYPVDASAGTGDGYSGREASTLGEQRAEIDIVDGQIVDLIGIRTRLVEKVASFKKDPSSVRDVSREEAVISRVRSIAAAKGADPDMIEGVYRFMISHYVKMQKDALGDN